MKSCITGLENIHLFIDGVIFQIHQGKQYGISKIWKNLLDFFDNQNPFGKITILNRGYLPEFESFNILQGKKYDPSNYVADSRYLDEICKIEEANLFISTYFTNPISIYTICLLHDMIPEYMGFNLNSPEWLCKIASMRKAKAFFAVSNNTIYDFRKMYPEHQNKPTYLIYNTVPAVFKKYDDKVCLDLTKKLGLTKPYFTIIGKRGDYKNSILFFKAFGRMKNRDNYQILCVGGYPRLEYLYRQHLNNSDTVINATLTDQELSQVLNTSLSMVYPSLYEGFGLPLLEAINSHCPVICISTNKAAVEVASYAAIYTDPYDVDEMRHNLEKVALSEKLRKDLIIRGFLRAVFFNNYQSHHHFFNAIIELIPNFNNYYGVSTNDLG